MRTGHKSSATVSILFVEDDEYIRESLHRSLSQRHPEITVFFAGNGAEGLKLFQEQRPEITVADLSITDRGAGLISGIRSIDPEAVIIAVTAPNDSTHLLEPAEIGIQYLMKPSGLATLSASLLEAIGPQLETMQMKRQAAAQNNRIRLLSMAVEQSPSSVLITDENGIIEYVNPKFCAASGYSPDEVVGQNPRILKSGLTAARTYADLWRTVTSGGTWQGELQNRKKSGETYWVSMVASPVHDDDGTVHYVSVREIITDRKLVEQEHEAVVEFLHIMNACTGIHDLLTASVSFFKQRSRCKAVGIRLRDGEDYPYFLAKGFPGSFLKMENTLCSRGSDGQLSRDTNGVAVIHGLCGKVICGRTDPRMPFFTEQGSFWTNSMRELHAPGPWGEGNACERNRCSEAGFESVALIPLSVGAEHLGLLQLNDQRRGVFSQQDIDQWERLAGYLAIALLRFRAEVSLKRLNEELEQRVADRTLSLKAALKEQESFSYSVSHDLRAPLRHIDSYLSILAEDYGDLLPGEAHFVLERSRAASRRMDNLIDDLMELSRVSRISLISEAVNLSELAAEVSSALCETEPQRRVEVVIRSGLTARGDKSLLRQMMVNLLANAWKYTSKVAAARIEFGSVLADDQEIFYVKDNGVGFDMAYSEKLFGEFQRLHGPEYEGTGIGLATVKRIVERHRGRVWADSKPGQGATFFFVLP